jgi:hypothetical protein
MRNAPGAVVRSFLPAWEDGARIVWLRNPPDVRSVIDPRAAVEFPAPG